MFNHKPTRKQRINIEEVARPNSAAHIVAALLRKFADDFDAASDGYVLQTLGRRLCSFANGLRISFAHDQPRNNKPLPPYLTTQQRRNWNECHRCGGQSPDCDPDCLARHT